MKNTPTPKAEDVRCPVRGCKDASWRQSTLWDVSSRICQSMGRITLQCETDPTHIWTVAVTEEAKMELGEIK